MKKKLLTAALCVFLSSQNLGTKNWWAVAALSIDNDGNHISSEDYGSIERVEIKFRIKDFVNTVEKKIKRVYNQY